MKYATHIRIRVSEKLNQDIEKSLQKTENKSDFIRCAIIEKIEKLKSNETHRNRK